MMTSPRFSTYLRRNKMAVLWLILVLTVSLEAQVDATQVAFAKRFGKIYVETDSKHYALYGQVSDRDGVRIIAVDKQGQHHLTSKCDTDWTKYKEIGVETLSKYRRLREMYLESKGIPKDSPRDYIWTESLIEVEKVEEQQVVRKIDDNTFIYASKYFPKFLARVIISENVVIYVRYDGTVTMKTMNCLYLHEKVFIEGIKKINTDKRKIPLLSSKPDKVLQKHLKSKNFDEDYFKRETKYFKTYTKAELERMQNAIRGAGYRAFDGWGP